MRTVIRIPAWLVAGAASCMLAILPPALAEIPAAEQAAIEHLLEFIAQSDCRFNRNGRSYGSDRAYRHVMRKFDYFRDEIETAEDFIELAATRSTRSGEAYRFECDGQSTESAAVLAAELRRYRERSR